MSDDPGSAVRSIPLQAENVGVPFPPTILDWRWRCLSRIIPVTMKFLGSLCRGLKHLPFARAGSLRRWCGLFLLSVVGAVVFILLAPAIRPIADWLEARLAPWPFGCRLAILFIVLASAFVPLLRLKAFSACSFRGETWRAWGLYPPTLLAGVIFGPLFVVAIGALHQPPEYRLNIDWLGIYACLPVAIGAVVLIQWLHSRRQQRPEHRSSKGSSAATDKSTFERLAADPRRLIQWVEEPEEPIQEVADDLFDLKPLAERMARQILEKPQTSFGLIGPYGCGKTSLLHLVEHYLQHPELLPDAPPTPSRVWACRVDGWGLDDGPSACRFILQRAVDEVAKHADCLSVVGMPGDYAACMGKVGSNWIASVVALLEGPDRPVETLRRLDNVLMPWMPMWCCFLRT
jgi:hypothetical protein